MGPGTYFSFDSEDQRNGWAPKSFSRRQPMAPPNSGPAVELRKRDKDNTTPSKDQQYKNNIMTPQGMIISPKPEYFKQTPGPGHYNIDICTTSFPIPTPIHMGNPVS